MRIQIIIGKCFLKTDYRTAKGASFECGAYYYGESNADGSLWELVHPDTHERACFAAREVGPPRPLPGTITV